MRDYKKYYDVEKYLLSEVGPAFRSKGKIAALDFYLIVIWKSRRAKGRTRTRISKKAGSFESAVQKIANAIYRAESDKKRLEILMKDWDFRLPMATAILTILYPSTFSIYDVRVVGSLGSFEELGNRKFSDQLWKDYQRFLSSVRAATPRQLSLREKDHYLWGKSFYTQAADEISEKYRRR